MHVFRVYRGLFFCLVSIHRAALWILGEYCTSVEDIARVVAEIRTALGEVGVFLRGICSRCALFGTLPVDSIG